MKVLIALLVMNNKFDIHLHCFIKDNNNYNVLSVHYVRGTMLITLCDHISLSSPPTISARYCN